MGGGNVAEYMEKLKDDDEEAYAKQFSQYVKAGIDGDALEAMYEKCTTPFELTQATPRRRTPRPARRSDGTRPRWDLPPERTESDRRRPVSSTLSRPRNKFILSSQNSDIKFDLNLSKLITPVRLLIK